MEQELKDYIWDYKDSYAWMGKVRSGLPPLIVSCALTGGMHGKEVNGNLPETAEEQAAQAEDAYKTGASIIHVHARNPGSQWMMSSNPEDYREANAQIRERCPDVIINNTTGGGPGFTLEQSMASVFANPEMCSLNLGPFVTKSNLPERPAPLPHPRPARSLEVVTPIGFGHVTALAKAMRERGIKPELELYNSGQFWMAQDLIAQGLLDPPYDFQFVMGMQMGSYPTPANLLGLINELPARSIFTVIGLGQFQTPMTVMSILLGGHVRVGMEDNVYLSRGRKLENNAEAVERIVQIARAMNREVATPRQARQMLGLSQEPSRY